MKRLFVTLDIWEWHGWVLTGGDPASFAALARKKFADCEGLDDPEMEACTLVLEGHPWALWVRDITNTVSLAHEALHVACKVLRSRGLTLTNESEEAYTYTMDYILRAVQSAKPRDWKRI